MLGHDEKTLSLEKELLAKVAKGDQRAFKLFYDQYHRRIYTFCLRQLKSVEFAEEVLQETFLKIWLMEEELLKINNAEAYLRTIARNRCFDYMRKLEREARIYASSETGLPEPSHNDTEESIMLADTKELLLRGVALLPPQQKLVYQLCQQQGLKYEEAAKELQLSPLTVKNHMQAALRFLRQYMSSHTNLAIAVIVCGLIDRR